MNARRTLVIARSALACHWHGLVRCAWRQEKLACAMNEDGRADIDDAQSKTRPLPECHSSPHDEADHRGSSSSDFRPRKKSS